MLEDLKLLLGFTDEDAERDKRLNWIIDSTNKRLQSMLGGVEPPDELDYIVVEVAVIRFNKLGSEGVAIHTVEGESQHFTDDDFAAFRADIDAWLDKQHAESGRGKVRFL